MLRWQSFYLWSLLLLANGCGTEIGNPKRPKDDTTTPKNALEDSQASSDLTAALVDETVVALAGDSSSDSSSLTLTGAAEAVAKTGNDAGTVDDSSLNLLAGRVYDSKCAENGDGSAQVTQVASGEATTTFKRGKRTLENTVSGDDTLTLKWSQAGQSIKCNKANTHVVILMRRADNLTLATEFKYNRVSRTVVKGESTLVNERTQDTTGSRTITWLPATVAESGEFTRDRSLKQDVSHTLNVHSKAGSASTLTATSTIAEASPLIIETTYSDTLIPQWKKHTIKSGTISSELKDATELDLTYTNVVYEKGQGCMPTSGSIAGKYLKKADGSVIQSFTIDFNSQAEGVATITFANGDTNAYTAGSCVYDN